MLAKAMACAATAMVIWGMCATSVARAADEVAINGTYTVFSDGQ